MLLIDLLHGGVSGMVVRFVQTLVTLKPLEVCSIINIRSNNTTIDPNDEKLPSPNWNFSVVKRYYADAAGQM